MRVYGLDILRFLAAIWILFFHYTFTGYLSNKMTLINLQEIGFFFKYGFFGVQLFFMISGFVILMTVENKNMILFIKSRFLRLYPTYWIAMSITSIVILYFGSDRYSVNVKEYVYNLTMLSNLFNIKYIDGVYWTLFLEIKFYFLIFLLLVFRQITNIKFYLIGWLLLIYINYFSPFPWIIKFFLIPEYAAYFIVGAFFYLGYKSKFMIKDIIFIILSYIISCLYLLPQIDFLSNILNTSYDYYFGFIIIFIFYILFFVLSIKQFSLNNNLKKNIITLGGLTYPLYLIHENIGFIIFNMYYLYFNKYILLFMVIVLMLITAYMIYFFEKKMMKWFKLKIENRENL